MKKYIKIIAVTALSSMMLPSCSSDFLDVEPEGLTVESNYYRNEAEAFAGLASVYDLMRKKFRRF